MFERICKGAAVEYGDKDRLVVLFSSMTAPQRDSFDLIDYPKNLPYTKLYLRDDTVSLGYHAGVDGLTESIEETCEFLRVFIDRLKPERTTFFGISIGGYAAKLHGYLVGADDIHVVNTVTFIDHENRDRLGGERWPGAFDPVYEYYASRGEAPRHLDLRPIMRENVGGVTVTRVHYAADDDTDKIQLGHIQDLPTVQPVAHARGGHRFLAYILCRDDVPARDFATPLDELAAGSKDGAGPVLPKAPRRPTQGPAPRETRVET